MTEKKNQYTPGQLTLRYVVESCLNERDDYTKGDFKRYLQFAIDGFREFSMYHIPCLVRKWCPVDQDIYTVDYPDDCIKLLSVRTVVEGREWTYSKFDNTELRVIPECQTLNDDRMERDNRSERPVENYGMVGYNRFQYIDVPKERRVVVFGPPRDEVRIYYKATGIKLGEETLIPVHALGALKAYVHFAAVDTMLAVPENYKARRERRLFEEKMKMRDFENMFTREDFIDAIISGYSQTYKR